MCVGARCKRAYFVIQATDRVLPVIRWVSELPHSVTRPFHLSISRCRRVCLFVFCCGFVVVVVVVVVDDDNDDNDDDDDDDVLLYLFAEKI